MTLRRVASNRSFYFIDSTVKFRYASGCYMPRTDLYIKVQIDHDREETPEKVAAEICRQIQKNYNVRRAELSSYVRQGE